MEFGKNRVQPELNMMSKARINNYIPWIKTDVRQRHEVDWLTVWHIELSFRLTIFFGFLLSLLLLSPCGLTPHFWMSKKQIEATKPWGSISNPLPKHVKWFAYIRHLQCLCLLFLSSFLQTSTWMSGYMFNRTTLISFAEGTKITRLQTLLDWRQQNAIMLHDLDTRSICSQPFGPFPTILNKHQEGLPGRIVWHQDPEVCTTLASLNQNRSKLTASPGMHLTALWHSLNLFNNVLLHMLLRMTCLHCLLAQSHCLPENLVYVWLEMAPEGHLFECFVSLYLQQELELARVSGSQNLEFHEALRTSSWTILLSCKRWHCTAGSLALHVLQDTLSMPSKHHSSGRNHPRPQGYAAGYSWKQKLIRRTGHLEICTKVELMELEFSCQRFLPAWSHWKPAGSLHPLLHPRWSCWNWNPPPGTSVWSARVLSFHVPGPKNSPHQSLKLQKYSPLLHTQCIVICLIKNNAWSAQSWKFLHETLDPLSRFADLALHSRFAACKVLCVLECLPPCHPKIKKNPWHLWC